ncbi:hypothetical protein ACPCVO_35850 [Streptomyces umbrinus]|uniref:hypothetical protein n=1 Tax=Streptomyces umbrinus TaxID=67370 RepID=UPI003C2DC43E
MTRLDAAPARWSSAAWPRRQRRHRDPRPVQQLLQVASADRGQEPLHDGLLFGRAHLHVRPPRGPVLPCSVGDLPRRRRCLADRCPDLAATHATDGDVRPPGLVWELHSGYVLRPEGRIGPTSTRQGLAELLGRRPRPRPAAP